jgi:hypothetical protein
MEGHERKRHNRHTLYASDGGVQNEWVVLAYPK